MFRLMRNVHLILGLVFFFYAMLFALSSLVIIYRPWLKLTREAQERTVHVAAESIQTPRALALELMQRHGLKGELRDIKQEGEEMRFSIVRPGTQSDITYSGKRGLRRAGKGSWKPSCTCIRTMDSGTTSCRRTPGRCCLC